MPDQEDGQLARGLKAGEAGAWSALYEAHFDGIWRLVARMIGPDAGAVADVVQETFLAAARSARTFDPRRGSLWQWLAGIARNHAGTYFRSRERISRLGAGGNLRCAVADQWVRRLEGGTTGPSEACASSEAAALVRAALSQLPDDYQTVLTARYCDDVPVDELARLQECSVAAIRSRLARARRAFRETFAGPSPRGQDGDAGADDGHE